MSEKKAKKKAPKAKAKPATKKASKPKKDMMGFFVKPAERKAIEKNANAAGLNFSEWMREAAILYRRKKGA